MDASTKPSTKLWEKGILSDAFIENFTVGRDREFDMLLAEFDVLGSVAHVEMLTTVGLLRADERDVLVGGLKDILVDIRSLRFQIEPGVEDVHTQVELILTRKFGDLGKKIHSARSRNDQVALDIKLYLRSRIALLLKRVQVLFGHLIELAETNKDVVIPGYTHMQVAMPSSFGLWFSAYAEALVDDTWQLAEAYRMCDRNPLGSAAGYGSSMPIDRDKTTELLGFGDLHINSVYAQMSRGRTERVVAASLSTLASTLNKLASDVTLYVSQNYGFIEFPDFLTTGSSIMPHKKNPDLFEIIRAKTSLVQALPGQIGAVLNNLPSGYHRDVQVVKEVMFTAIAWVESCLEAMIYAMQHIGVRPDSAEKPAYDAMYSVELVNTLVLQGMPFRDAYRHVAALIEAGTYVRPEMHVHTHVGSIGNLGLDRIRMMMDTAFHSVDIEKAEEALRMLSA